MYILFDIKEQDFSFMQVASFEPDGVPDSFSPITAASDTVGYIYCKFVFSKEWDGLTKQVNFMNFTQRKVYTVNLEGNTCQVPVETMTREGEVQLSITGFETEGGELIKRLTTFTKGFLNIDKALPSGEASKITPTQFEQFVSLCQSYKVDAESARDSALASKTSAEQSANSASASATSAEEDATLANLKASSAASSASQALTSANLAEGYAEDAEEAAEMLENLTVSAESSQTPTVTKQTVSGHYNFLFGLPKGDPGEDGSQVSVSSTGTSTNEVQYITIDDVEYKLAGGGTEEVPEITVTQVVFNSLISGDTTFDTSVAQDVLQKLQYNNKVVFKYTQSGAMGGNTKENKLVIHKGSEVYSYNGSMYFTVKSEWIGAYNNASGTAQGVWRGFFSGGYGYVEILEDDAYYATISSVKSDIPTKTSELTNDSGFLTEHQSLANYYTKSEADSAISSHHDSTKYDASNPQGYTSNEGTVTSVAVSMNGATKGTVTTSGTIDLGTVLTEHQSLDGYATQTWVGQQGFLTQHQDISGKEDKSNKVTSISSASTDTEYPSAKCVYDIVGNVEATLQAIRGV